MPRMSEVTRLIEAARTGSRRAAEELLPLVYDELRKLAGARMAHEATAHTLSATALVHEAYLRLVGDQRFDGRGHFFAAARSSATGATKRRTVFCATSSATSRTSRSRRGRRPPGIG